MQRLSELEEKLQFHNILLETQNEASPEGILVISPDGQIISINSQYSKIWGVDRDEIFGHSEEIRLKILKKKVKDKTSFVESVQKINRHPKQTYSDEIELSDNRWIERYTTPLTGKDGVHYGRIWFVRDITERKREIEEQKYFLGIASHELKTPLASIKAYVHLAHKEVARKKFDVIDSYIDKIDQQTNHLNKLIKDFLDITLIRSDRLELVKEVFDFDEFIMNVVTDMKPTTTHQIIMRGLTKSYINADQYRLHEVFTNLIRNATKYSPHADKIIITLTSNAKSVSVSIRDYGVGIPVHMKDRIFDLFFRATQESNRRIQGFGVGLYISAQIVKKHSGEIAVESNPGKGSTFTVTLPIK